MLSDSLKVHMCDAAINMQPLHYETFNVCCYEASKMSVVLLLLMHIFLLLFRAYIFLLVVFI